MTHDAATYDWRRERNAGAITILVSMVVFAALWFAIRYYAPAPSGMDDLGARMVFTLKCCCIATLFCFVTGIEAVAHERLQSAAFDPLQQFETRRLRVSSGPAVPVDAQAGQRTRLIAN